MNLKVLPIIALLAFAAAPVVIGSAEQAKKETSSESKDAKEAPGKADAPANVEAAEVAAPARKVSHECLASEEVIQDLEAREKKLKQREEALKEKEKDLVSQQNAVKDEMTKLEGKRADLQSVHQKELSDREEQVAKLIETFEGMSPKAAAQVMAGVDEELAVMSLGRMSSAKAGKILANLKPEKSARLSEMMAYGKAAKGKESSRVESENRAPASKP